jgi:hypothetical protein
MSIDDTQRARFREAKKKLVVHMNCTHCGLGFEAEILEGIHKEVQSRNPPTSKPLGTCLTCQEKYPEEGIIHAYRALTGGSGLVN